MTAVASLRLMPPLPADAATVMTSSAMLLSALPMPTPARSRAADAYTFAVATVSVIEPPVAMMLTLPQFTWSAMADAVRSVALRASSCAITAFWAAL